MDLLATYRKVIIANELDGDLGFITKFSDPDGVRSGKSGWSFGLCQFDINNNPVAMTCLQAIGFSSEQIAGLRAQTIDVHPLESLLKAHADIIAKFDDAQLSGTLLRSQNILAKYGIRHADDTAILAVADYANQYYLSDVRKPGYLVGYLAGLGRPFRADDVLKFKLDYTAYGKTHKSDCQRRYKNLIDIVGKG
jgi:hypothetical protein